jgi:hypothetical protein
MYISGAFDPRWNNDVLNPAFRALSASDFDVIELGWRGGACVAPGAPQALSASVTGQLVQLNWLPPAAGGQQDYVLEAGSAPGATAVSFALPNSSFAVTAPPGRYHVRTRARNACGTSAASNEVVVTVGGCSVPPAPANFRFTRVGSLVTLNWDAASGANDYLLEVGAQAGTSNLLVVPLPGAPVSAVAPAGTYFARVRGRNGCGAGSPSNEITVVM